MVQNICDGEIVYCKQSLEEGVLTLYVGVRKRGRDGNGLKDSNQVVTRTLFGGVLSWTGELRSVCVCVCVCMCLCVCVCMCVRVCVSVCAL